MSTMLVLDNAIRWGHYRLGGGWRNLASTCVAAAALMAGIIVATLRMEPTRQAEILFGWVYALLSVQIGLLILLGCSAVRNAIRRDITTGMIESHRLMPVSGTTAVAGYLTGPTLQASCLAAVTFIVGAGVARGAGMPLSSWVLANAVLGAFAVSAWAVVSFVAWKTRFGMGMLLLAILVGWIVIPMVPGMMLPLAPILRGSVYDLLNPAATWDGTYRASAAAHVTFAIFCYIAASRRYRRDDVLSFEPLVGLWLLAAWAVCAVTGIIVWYDIEPKWYDKPPGDRDVQLIASMLVTMLVAIVPVYAAAWSEGHWLRRRRRGDPHRGRRPIPSILTVVLATLICVIVVRLSPDPSPASLGLSALATLFYLLSVSWLLRALYRRGTKAGLVTALWIAATWLGPWLAELVRQGLLGFVDAPLSWIVGCSPAGTLMYVWVGWELNVVPGLVVQGVMAAGLAAACYGSRSHPPAGTDRSPPTSSDGSASSSS